MVEEEESIYLRNLKVDLIPLGTVDLDALLLFSLRDFSTAGSRGGHAAAFVPSSSPRVSICAWRPLTCD